MGRSWISDISAIIVLSLLGVLAVVLLSGVLRRKPVTLLGAVMVEDTDARKQLPIAGVQVTASVGLATVHAVSESSGLFSIAMPKYVRRGQALVLKFEHVDYKTLTLHEFTGDKVYIARMARARPTLSVQLNRPRVVVGNIVVRYSVKATATVNIGSAVKAFEVVNKGDVPCNGKHPCSPDGKWKATSSSATLDAGAGNEFRNVRASCIAGPCPFTKIDFSNTQQSGPTLIVSATNWSDAATFLVEAEVVHPMISNTDRQSYPVIFGPALNFTLPSTAEGVSIEADLNGESIVFPLGPDLRLSWAECNARTNSGDTKVYRCELKPGFRFK